MHMLYIICIYSMVQLHALQYQALLNNNIELSAMCKAVIDK